MSQCLEVDQWEDTLYLPAETKKGDWLNVMEMKNHSSDVSPTGSQMPRLLGLAQASKVYRNYKTKKP